MKVYRIWRCSDPRSGGTVGLWTYESARAHMAEIARRGRAAQGWEPLDPYRLQTAIQIEVFNWRIRTRWKTLLTVDAPN